MNTFGIVIVMNICCKLSARNNEKKIDEILFMNIIELIIVFLFQKRQTYRQKRRMAEFSIAMSADGEDADLHSECDRGNSNRKRKEYVKLLKLSENKSKNMLLDLDKNNQSSLITMAEDPNISSENMQLLVKVLATAASNNSCQVVGKQIILTVFSPIFINKLLEFASQCTDPHFMSNLNKLVSYYMNNHEFGNHELNFKQLICSVSLLVNGNASWMNDVIKLDVRVAKLLEKTRTDVEVDSFCPDDKSKLDFRSQQIEPSADDMDQNKSKFRYFNKTVGHYANVDTYLETHFHMLREDFLRPLREGLHQYLNRIEGRNLNISVYEKVRIIGMSIRKEKFFYRVKLSVDKKHTLGKTSKNILEGNLVLISNDNFESCHVAVIEEREENLLEIGIVGITFLSEIKVDMLKSYTLIEPTVFYISYKHVLTALQYLNQDNFPLAEHIVYVEKEVCAPVYLSASIEGLKSNYDLSVVINPSLMLPILSRHSVFAASDKPESSKSALESGTTADIALVVHYSLKNVIVTDDIEFWPSADKLQLDESQLAALRHALTSRMALIQGPPGTGKTFIGLKIVQTLLHNAGVWRSISPYRNSQTPVLIVCYTNHALDQFLVEIKSITRKIVRIGGGCKNDDLKINEIQEIMQNISRKKNFPPEIGSANYILHKEVRDLENRFSNLQRRLTDAIERRGIIKLDLFQQYKIIPHELFLKLFSRQDYLYWILSNPEKDNISTINQCDGKLAQICQDLSLHEPETNASQEMINIEASTTDFEILLETLQSKLNSMQNESRSSESMKEENKIRKKITALETLPVYVPDDILYLEVQTDVDIYDLTFQDRLLLYASWKKRLEVIYRGTIKHLEEMSIKVHNSTKFDQMKTPVLEHSQLLFCKSQLKGLLSVKGLVKFETFVEKKIVSYPIRKQLTSSLTYIKFLFNYKQNDAMLTPSAKMWNMWKSQPNARLSYGTSVWQENVEAYREMLAVKSDNLNGHHSVDSSEEFFEVTPLNYSKRIIALHQQKECTDDDTLVTEINELQTRKKKLNHILMMIKECSNAPETEVKVNVPNLPLIDRCRLYASWRRSLIEMLHQEMSLLRDELQELAAERLAIRTSQYLHICRQADVVGMTTTGAAKWQSLLNDLKPKIGECVNV